MSKKHFIAMAEYIAAHTVKAGDRESAAFVRGMINLAVYLGRTFGPRFDEARFIAACGDNANV